MNFRPLLCVLLIVFILLPSGCLDNGNDVPDSTDNGNSSELSDSDASGAVSSNITDDMDYRQQMRNFVIGISNYSKQKNPDFIIIPQNGQELSTFGGSADILLAHDYITAIDGIGREDLFFGYDGDNIPTDKEDTEYMMSYLDIAENNNVEILVTDYCSNLSYVDTSYNENYKKGYISFAASSRDLDTVPAYPAEPFNSNINNILSLHDARNFLYIINPDKSDSKEDFIQSLRETDYDILIIDMFYDDQAFTEEDVLSLKSKANGGTRLVIAYMSIGEAEDYRYYWNDSWTPGSPEWLESENPDWEGNYKVRYWDSRWQSLIYGDENAYLDMIQDAGFDGVYLDIIDAFEYFEEKERQV